MRPLIFVVFVVVLIVLAGVILPIDRAHAQGINDDFQFETSAFMGQSTYRNVVRMNQDSAQDGAYGPVNHAWDVSHTGKWYIEEQRYGSDLVGGGIASGDANAIDRGLSILSWGFRQQQPDGGFDCPDAFHSTSFFVEATAHSLLLLESSAFAQRYRPVIEDMKPRLHAAARWMIEPKNEGPGRKHNEPFTHRRYLVAAALGETGILLHDAALIARSADYIREGEALQDASGFNPERGGWDSSYHAVGMVFAERYYTIVADDSLRPALFRMLEKAAAWEASRVNPEGEISTEGNTRVGGIVSEENRSGKAKKVAVSSAYRAFYYWSRISGDARFEQLAKKIAARAHQWSP